MKKIFTKLMLLAVAAAALVSCENNYEEQAPVAELTQTVTLSADKTAVRTELIEGVPYWSKGDKIGVYTEEKNLENEYYLTNDAEEATLTTTFTGQTALSETIYVFYPSKGYGSNLEKGAKTEIPAIQHPTATSFDGAADIMFAKPVTLNEEGQQLSGLEFARVGAIVKVVLNDKTGNLADQHLSTVKMTAATNLVGRVYLDVINQELGELYYDRSTSVSAEYAEPIAANNPVYLVVYPQTLAAGSKLTIEAATEGYAISRSRELGKDFVLEAGKVNTLTVNLEAEDVIKEDTGLALPFEDDFAWVTGTNENTDISASLKGEYYASGAKTYSANGALKFGSSSVAGVLTTVPLNLSQPFTVIVKAKNYGTDETKVKVTVGETTQTVTLTADYAYYALEFEAASKKETLTVASNADSKQRFYLDELQVVAGHDVVLPTLPPVLTVTKSEISVSHEAATETFTYGVANPVEGTNVEISDNADWITTETDGTTVNVTIAANEAEEAREGVVTVRYGDLTKTVTVKQAAKPAEGGPTTVVDVLTRNWTGSTSSSYAEWSGKTSNSTAVYKGKTAGGNSAIQFNTNNNSTIGIVTTASGGTVRKVVVTWQSDTSNGRTLDIYGKNTAYSAATDLYSTNSATKGTKLGSIVKGTSTELVIDGNYQFIGLRSNSGAMYITEIQITWESGEGGGSTPEPATPVLGVNPTTLNFDAAGGNKTVACTIENEVSSVNVTATETVDWLSTSVSGKTVTVTATENTTTSERTATVTISYQGAASKTVTVTQAAGESTGGDEGGETQPVTVTKTSFSAVSGSLDSVISYTTAKNDGTTAPAINSSAIRLYQPSSGKTNGGSITITAKEGYTITSITIGSNQKTTTAYSIDGGATSSNSDIAANGKLTVTKDAQSITFYCRGANSNSRLNVNYLSVTYK